jgi:hypothetical protein
VYNCGRAGPEGQSQRRSLKAVGDAGQKCGGRDDVRESEIDRERPGFTRSRHVCTSSTGLCP